jgi:hypothetical protein
LVRSDTTREVLRICICGDHFRSGHQLLGLLDHFRFLFRFLLVHALFVIESASNDLRTSTAVGTKSVAGLLLRLNDQF